MKVDALKFKIQEILRVDDLFLSYKKNPEDSDVSFIYKGSLKEDSQNVKKALWALTWFEKVEFKGPYINLWLKKSLLPLNTKDWNKKGFSLSRRMIQLSQRLKAEVKDLDGCIDDYWFPLVKAYNLCVIDIEVLKHISDESMKGLVETFKVLDLGYMYRRQSEKTLKGLLDVLEACLIFAERKTYEQYL